MTSFQLSALIILNKNTSIERKLNGLEALHKRLRNDEIEAKIGAVPNNTRFDKLLKEFKEHS